jgi:mRNA interferase RelE/StbE
LKWQIKFEKSVTKELKKLKRQNESMYNKIKAKLEDIQNFENPRQLGKNLKGNLKGYWRYRIEDYRVICEIKDKEFIILVVEVAHRREAYKTK